MTPSNRPDRLLGLAHGRSLTLGGRAVIMGILNVTPDSFSDGGRFSGDIAAAVDAALRMVDDGAAIVDIGGESTRPGAEPIDADEERRRVLPVIERLAARSNCLISIDTYRAETAERAIAAGAHLINDVWAAQKEPAIAEIAAATGAALCLMHTGRGREAHPDPIDDQRLFLSRSLAIARAAGVADDRLVLDPGFGFAKDNATNIELMQRFSELGTFGLPLLVGASRKRFVRALVQDAFLVDAGTAATSVLLRQRGASIFRVHDVASNRAALAVVDAVMAAP